MELDDFTTKQIHKTLFRIGSEVANEAKDLVPYKTGNLERDIQVFDSAIAQGEIVVGNSKMAHYAPYVHQGTGREARGKSKAPHKKGMKARPYLEEAMENYIKSGAVDRALENMGKATVQEFGKKLKSSLRNVKIV